MSEWEAEIVRLTRPPGSGSRLFRLLVLSRLRLAMRGDGETSRRTPVGRDPRKGNAFPKTQELIYCTFPPSPYLLRIRDNSSRTERISAR